MIKKAGDTHAIIAINGLGERERLSSRGLMYCTTILHDFVFLLFSILMLNYVMLVI